MPDGRAVQSAADRGWIGVNVKRWVSWLAAGAIVLSGTIAAAPEAAAASPLVASNPAPKEQLTQRPGWVTLAFSRTVEKSLLKVLVVGSDGRNNVVGDPIYQGSSVMVQLSDTLKKDTYTVKYQINRADGQPEGGAYQFAFGKGNWTKVASSWSGTAEQPPEMANPDPMATTAEVTPTSTPPVVQEGTPTASASASEHPTVSPTPGATGQPTQATAPPTPQGGSPWPWVGLGVVVLAAAGAGSWLWARSRRRP